MTTGAQMEEGQGKFCPSCKLWNAIDATVCVHCGVPFEEISGEGTTISDVTGGTYGTLAETLKDIEQKSRNVPIGGIAFFFPDTPRPFEVRTDDEFLIGRKTEEEREKIVDLIPYDAYGLGVSRRHVKIRRVADGYEAIDLESTNGTWINELRLTPNIPYHIPNGAFLRLGKMPLYVIYRQA
jgi:hypothetical protein